MKKVHKKILSISIGLILLSATVLPALAGTFTDVYLSSNRKVSVLDKQSLNYVSDYGSVTLSMISNHNAIAPKMLYLGFSNTTNGSKVVKREGFTSSTNQIVRMDYVAPIAKGTSLTCYGGFDAMAQSGYVSGSALF